VTDGPIITLHLIAVDPRINNLVDVPNVVVSAYLPDDIFAA